ncbi:MAG TPA: porin family protein [Bacteroidia bacterium]|nr:porin family protein [Bacteroidia bacterium]
MNKFKNLPVAIATLIIFSSSSQGQVRKFSSGMEGGFNLSSLRGNPFYESHHDFRTGPAGGVFIQYNLNKTYAIKTGVYFETKGSKFEVISGDHTEIIFRGKNNLDFLVIPVILKAGTGEKLYFSVNGGFYYGYLLNQSETTEGEGDVIILNAPQILRPDYFKKSEIGILAGFGIACPIKQRFLVSLEMRNNFGLNDISRFKEYNGGVTKTYSANFLFGFAFKFG